MGDDGAQIIVFPVIPGSDAIGPPAEITNANTPRAFLGECEHRKCTLDDTAHRMYCRDCNQELDCFDWIVDYTRRWARFNTEYRQAIVQRDAALKEVAELERKAKNLKARMRRPGVNLTRGQLRTIHDNLRALRSGLDYLARDQLHDEDSRYRLRTELKLVGVDFEKVAAVRAFLADLVEMRDPETELEETPAAV